MHRKSWIVAIVIVIIGVAFIFFIGQRKQANKEDVEEEIIIDEYLDEVKEYSQYTVEISVDEEAKFYKGIAQISYIHNYDRVTERILMNAEGIRVSSIQLNSDPVAYTEEKSDILIQSPFTIEKGEELTLTIEFEGMLDNNIIPTILAFDEELGWSINNGRKKDFGPLIELGNYVVTVFTPKGKYPIGTGIIEDILESNGMIETSFRANRVRGFGIFIDDHMEKETINTEAGYSVVLYYQDEDDIAKELMPEIEKSIGIYSEIFGMYPYEQFTVIHKKDQEGKSYPTLVAGDFSTWIDRRNTLNILVGKQWLGYIIGSNRKSDSLINDGLLEYLSKRQYLSEGQMKSYIESNEGSDDTYGLDNYQAIMNMFYNIEIRLGEEGFMETLRAYYRKYSFGRPTGYDLMETIEEVTGKDVMDIYDLWLNRTMLRGGGIYESNNT
ncbi:MAG: M1 family metallopeptidase [Epulopiscium sp.]|nr:M1 family metallopeptidase [Candidatus Epulonipiscium sp.]